MSRKMTISLLVIAALAILTLAMISARPSALQTSAADRLSDYALRHPISNDLFIRVSGIGFDTRSTDYAARHPELSRGLLRPADTSDYYFRTRLVGAASALRPVADLTDYAARHPGVSLGAARPIDTTDYYFRQTHR
jgi:hypothetical protein